MCLCIYVFKSLSCTTIFQSVEYHSIMIKKIIFFTLLLASCPAFSQPRDEASIKSIFDEALKNGKSYEMLQYLTQNIGPRLSGSPGASSAVAWGKGVMIDWEFDSVWVQPVMVPHWVRGQKEIGKLIGSKKKDTLALSVCALGGSVGTGPEGVKGKIVEVKTFEELAQLGTKNVRGKIVFFNRRMDPTLMNPFLAYQGAVDQRSDGASEAVKYGAIGVIVRSMNSNLEDYPHTGSMKYKPGMPKIPALAVSTRHADLLSKLAKEDKDLQFYFETHCETLDDVPSFNVVGEIKGGEYADEIIALGGHLDSWDLAEGAHDDGAGCVQAIEALRLFKAIGYRPKRTLRAVLFMNEENGLRGGKMYAELAAKNKEKHIAAIESDQGGFTPRGFSTSGVESAKAKIRNWKPLLEPYGLTDFTQEGAGADIEPLGQLGALLIDYLPDPQRYFDYHHTPEDTFDKVSRRELELGSASIAALVYLMDQYGLK